MEHWNDVRLIILFFCAFSTAQFLMRAYHAYRGGTQKLNASSFYALSVIFAFTTGFSIHNNEPIGTILWLINTAGAFILAFLIDRREEIRRRQQREETQTVYEG